MKERYMRPIGESDPDKADDEERRRAMQERAERKRFSTEPFRGEDEAEMNESQRPSKPEEQIKLEGIVAAREGIEKHARASLFDLDFPGFSSISNEAAGRIFSNMRLHAHPETSETGIAKFKKAVSGFFKKGADMAGDRDAAFNSAFIKASKDARTLEAAKSYSKKQGFDDNLALLAAVVAKLKPDYPAQTANLLKRNAGK